MIKVLPANEEPAEPALTAEDYLPLKQLVRRTMRTFFEPKETIIMDFLTSTPLPAPILDMDLGKVLGVTAKEVGHMVARLVTHRLLRKEQKEDAAKKGATKPSLRNVYFLDYKQFLDVMKWKLYTMQQITKQKIEYNMDARGYECPECGRQYTILQAQSRLFSYVDARGETTFEFRCEAHPETKLEERDADDTTGADELGRLSEQQRPLLDLIRQCDNIKLPRYSVRDIVEQLKLDKKEREEREKQAAAAGGGLAVSAEGGVGMAATVTVEISRDGEIERKRLEEAEKLRKENELPKWHRYSMVTGEPTEHIEEKMLVEDEQVEEDNDDDDDYPKEYLAHLSQLTTSSAGEKRGRSDESDDDHTSHDHDDMMSVDGSPYAAHVKRRRVDPFYSGAPPYPPSSLSPSGSYIDPEFSAMSEDEAEDMDEDMFESVPLDPVPPAMVWVAGELLPLSKVGEAERERMSTDEYEAYYDACVEHGIVAV
ncbi:hypothetical protein GGF31_001081 [Allomyces arbusculus]|nr:hypothetical protein GGF31_001081 [Allomyces arbusculus]